MLNDTLTSTWFVWSNQCWQVLTFHVPAASAPNVNVACWPAVPPMALAHVHAKLAAAPEYVPTSIKGVGKV